MCLFTIGLFSPLFGDAPQLPPKTYIEHSNNKKYWAKVNYEDDLISVYEGNIKRWSMKGWYRFLYLSDSGEDIVISYWRGSLLALDYNKNEVMFWIIHKGELKHIIRLNDVIFNYTNLKRTSSHYFWASDFAFIDKTHFLIKTVEDNEIIIDIVDGTLKIKKN